MCPDHKHRPTLVLKIFCIFNTALSLVTVINFLVEKFNFLVENLSSDCFKHLTVLRHLHNQIKIFRGRNTGQKRVYLKAI